MNIPNGWPTDEMTQAGFAKLTDKYRHIGYDLLRSVFSAMYEAAPTPPSEIPPGFTAETWGALEKALDAGYDGNAMCVLPTPPVQSHHELDGADIKAIALDCGFKLKPQPDGLEDLNPYVYRFAREILSAIPRAEDVEALRQRPTPPAQEDEPVAWMIEIEVTRGNMQRMFYGHNTIGDYRAAFPDATSTPLYTHPANDKLRKAAEELLKITHDKGLYAISLPAQFWDAYDNLRVALEGK